MTKRIIPDKLIRTHCRHNAIIILFCAVLAIAMAGWADRGKPVKAETTHGVWYCERIDVGTGASQARFCPDGPMSLDVKSSGQVVLQCPGGAIYEGSVAISKDGTFRFKASQKENGDIAGTWTAGSSRMILSWTWDGKEISALFGRTIPNNKN